MKEGQELVSIIDNVENMDCTLHVSSESGHIDTATYLRTALAADQPDEARETETASFRPAGWVYVFGPGSLLRNTEAVCVNLRRDFRDMGDLSWYSTKWEV